MNAPSSPYKILLVEDAPDQAVLIGRWLTLRAKVELRVASSGPEAIALLEAEDFDLMLADIELPGCNGIEVARRAAELRPYMATALMTAHQSMDYARHAVQCHAADLVLKPLQRDDVVSKVRELAARAREHRQLKQKTVLAIGAHPDDVEIGCGGILLRHAYAGDRVVIFTLSGGARGGATDLRRVESQNAADLMNAELRMGNFEDTCIGADGATIAAISEVIRDFDPSIVYTHSLNDTHQDHRAVHHATLVAARGVPNLYCYQSPSSTTDYCPLAFVEIGDVLESKLQLIAAHRSQAEKCAYLDPGLIRATARYWGRFARNGRVEPLEVVRATGALLQTA